MKYVINNQVVLSRPPEGPLAAYVVSFAESLKEQRYAEYSVHRQVLLAACFSRWLEQNGVDVVMCDLAEAISPLSDTSLIFCAAKA